MIVASGGALPLWRPRRQPDHADRLHDGDDPVRLGLVASLARPGGNVTGINLVHSELAAKRLELLHELVPGAVEWPCLSNPSNPAVRAHSETTCKRRRARSGGKLQVLNASTPSEIDAAFATLRQEAAGALLSAAIRFSPAGASKSSHWRRAMRSPAMYCNRDFVEPAG